MPWAACWTPAAILSMPSSLTWSSGTRAGGGLGDQRSLVGVTAWLCAVEGAPQVWCWQEPGTAGSVVQITRLQQCWPCFSSLSQPPARLCSAGAASSHALQAAEGTLNTSLERAAWLLPETFWAFTLESSAALPLKEVTWDWRGADLLPPHLSPSLPWVHSQKV